MKLSNIDDARIAKITFHSMAETSMSAMLQSMRVWETPGKNSGNEHSLPGKLEVRTSRASSW